jgi:arsenate reductase (thioredoxin)
MPFRRHQTSSENEDPRNNQKPTKDPRLALSIRYKRLGENQTKRILFVCVENAGRSQMAEAFANKYGKNKFEISSAGNRPAEKVNSVVVEALKEKGIDISQNRPKLITFQMAQDADLIVTMGCNDQGVCPGPFFNPTIDWKLEDPKGKSIEKVREIRDDIERRVQKLLTEMS